MIFSTKNREPLIESALAPRLREYIAGICRGKGNVLVAAGGMPDHVHLLVSLGKQSSVADVVRDIKSNSSAWIHQTCPNLRAFAWQTGYGAFSVSQSNLDQVKAYITGQHEHHRVRSFQEEFLAFLERHHIEHDERYIWD
jgi:REP element-mobilizing transposase RayT